jgi:hypothetical protein
MRAASSCRLASSSTSRIVSPQPQGAAAGGAADLAVSSLVAGSRPVMVVPKPGSE